MALAVIVLGVVGLTLGLGPLATGSRLGDAAILLGMLVVVGGLAGVVVAVVNRVAAGWDKTL